MKGLEDIHPTYQKFMRERYLKAAKSSQKQFISLLRCLPAPGDLTKESVIEFISRPSQRDGRPLANDTIRFYLSQIEILAEWLERPEIIEGITKPKKRTLTREDILEMHEVRHLLQNTPDSRTRALLHLLSETGLRIDEALSIHIEDIQADGTRQKIVDGLAHKEQIMGRMWKLPIRRSKTFVRSVYAYHSTPSILAWLMDHPTKTGSLFVGRRRRVNGKLHYPELTYTGAFHLVTTAYINAGYQDEYEMKRIRKGLKIYPGDKELTKRLDDELTKEPIPHRRIHILRHAAGTQMTKERVQPKLMNRAMGWSPKSDASSVYIHLIDEDVEEEMRRRYGLSEGPEKKEPGIHSWHCPICGNLNPPTTGFCLNCPSRPEPMEDELQRMRDEIETLKTQRSEDLGKLALELIQKIKEKEKAQE